MSNVRIVAPNGDADNLLIWVGGVEVTRFVTVKSIEDGKHGAGTVVLECKPDYVRIDPLTRHAMGLPPKDAVSTQKQDEPVAEPVSDEAPGEAPALAHTEGEDLSQYDTSESLATPDIAIAAPDAPAEKPLDVEEASVAEDDHIVAGESSGADNGSGAE